MRKEVGTTVMNGSSIAGLISLLTMIVPSMVILNEKKTWAAVITTRPMKFPQSTLVSRCVARIPNCERVDR